MGWVAGWVRWGGLRGGVNGTGCGEWGGWRGQLHRVDWVGFGVTSDFAWHNL